MSNFVQLSLSNIVQGQKGDKVLIYAQARLAILYDTAANKIMAVGTVNLQSQSE